MIVGLTGGSGAGKSTVAKMFGENGFLVLNADEIAKQLQNENKILQTQIINCFGKRILTESGEIDRKKLGALVFSDRSKLKLLNSLTHPAIYEELRERARRETGDVLLDIPLLIDTPAALLCSSIVSVIAKPEIRIERIMKRDGISREDAENRIASQMTEREFRLKSTYVIENNGDLQQTEQTFRDLLKKLKG